MNTQHALLFYLIFSSANGSVCSLNPPITELYIFLVDRLDKGIYPSNDEEYLSKRFKNTLVVMPNNP